VEAGVVQQTHPYALQAGEAFEKGQNMKIMMIEMKMRIKIGGNRETENTQTYREEKMTLSRSGKVDQWRENERAD
jgi:hypothetical protein